MPLPSLILLCATAASAQPVRARPVFHRLYPDRAYASSFLKNDWNKYTENYHPNYVLDDNPKTAWVEGVEGNGGGETLTVRFSALSSARTVRLRIRNGYQKSRALFLANSAPRDVILTLLDAAGEQVFSKTVELERKMGWQQVDLHPPAKTQVAAVQLMIYSVYPGTKYKDTCVSDLQVLVDSDVPYDAKLEQSKRTKLAAWLFERKIIAAYFARLPKQYPFSATHFDAHRGPPHVDRAPAEGTLASLPEQVSAGHPPPAWKKLFGPKETARIRAFMKQVLPPDAKIPEGRLGSDWYRPAFKGRFPLPDGLDGITELTRVSRYLSASNFGLFEANSGTKVHQTAEAESSTHVESNLRATFWPKSRHAVRQIHFRRVDTIEGREPYIQSVDTLLSFDVQGHPRELLTLTDGSVGWTISAIGFSLDGRGRISKVTVKRAESLVDEESGERTANVYHSTTYTAATQS